jgi:hypothetical protein
MRAKFVDVYAIAGRDDEKSAWDLWHEPFGGAESAFVVWMGNVVESPQLLG